MRDIQSNAVSSDSDVAELLRQCLVLGTRLDNEPIREWATLELNGYPEDVELPAYRPKITTQVLGDLSGVAGSGLRNAELAPSALPQDWAHWHDRLFTYEVREGVAQLEYFARSGENTLAAAWPTDVVATLHGEFYEMMSLMRARQVVPIPVFEGVLSGIRNRVLQFALDIESESPELAEEGTDESAPRDDARVTQIFMNTIHGDNASLVASSSVVHQNISLISASLDALVANQGDRVAFLDAIAEDGAEASVNSPRVRGWLDRLSGGAIALAEGVTIQAATAVLLGLLES